jgi:asparagine synthase (glutamine-hydrolysing)
MKLNNLKDVVKIDENIPGNKTGKYFEKTKDGKRILRSALENYLPKDFTQAIKQGFSAPDATWFKGESIDYVKRVIYNDHAAIYQFLNPIVVRKLVEEHLQGKVNRRLLIWSFLNFEEWLKQMMEGR